MAACRAAVVEDGEPRRMQVAPREELPDVVWRGGGERVACVPNRVEAADKPGADGDARRGTEEPRARHRLVRLHPGSSAVVAVRLRGRGEAEVQRELVRGDRRAATRRRRPDERPEREVERAVAV